MMEKKETLRPGEDYVGVGIGAVIFDGRDKYFLSKRGREARNERGKWEFPGGGLEFWETMKDSIVREIKEEFDFEIEPGDQLPACDHILPEENQHWVAIAFMSKVKSGTPRIVEPHKCDEIGWFTLEEIDKMGLTTNSRFHYENLLKKDGSDGYVKG